MRSTDPRPWVLVALLSGLLGVAGPVPAQPTDGSAQDPAAGERLGDDEIAAFARAAHAVHAIRQGETEPVAPAVRQRMVEAVTAQGLTLERYNAIARRVRQEEDLYARYQKAWNATDGG